MKQVLLVLAIVPALFGLVFSDREWCGEGSSFKQAAAGTCMAYWDCDNGTVTFKQCSFMYSFDSIKEECVWNPLSSEEVPCGTHAKEPNADDDGWCSVGKKYNSPVAGLCGSYYECNEGYMNLKSCSWPSKFDAKERRCKIKVWPYTVNCAEARGSSSTPTTQTTITTSEPTTTPSNGTPQCSTGRTFVNVDPTDCSKYYSCADGVMTLKDCGYLMKFDPATLDCRYDLPWSSVDCSAAIVITTTVQPPSSSVVPNSPTTAKAESSKATTTTQTPNVIESDCQKGNLYTAPLDGDCMKYYICDNGHLTTHECSYMQRFDPITHECKYNVPWFDNVNCSAVPDSPVCKVGYSFKTRYPGNSKNYYNCDNGTLNVNECGYLQSFSQKTQACKYNVFGYNLKLTDTGLRNDVFVCKDEDYTASYTEDCRKYYVCKNGTDTIHSCPPVHKYEKQMGKCVAMTQCDLLTCSSKGLLCYPGYDYVTSDPGNNSKYRECKNGHLNSKICPRPYKFDRTTLKCSLSFIVNYNTAIPVGRKPKCDSNALSIVKPSVEKGKFDCGGNIESNSIQCMMAVQQLSGISTNLVVENPVCDEGQKFRTVYSKDCTKYYDCEKGKLSVKECSFMDKFDPKILDCRFDNPFYPVNCRALPGEPNCRVGANFQTVFPRHCDRYYDCKNGSLEVQKCHIWQKFDPATLECRINIPYVYSVNCSAIPGSEIEHSEQIIATPSSSDNFIVATTPKGSSCSRGQNFKAVYPADCKKYFDCSNGTETDEECFYFRKFDPATLQCRWDFPFYMVNCSAVAGSGLPKPRVYPERIRSRCGSTSNFKAVVKGACKSYYSCSNGTLSFHSCGLLEMFNPATLSCSLDLPFNRVNCSALPGEPECTKTSNYKKPYPGDCGKYYECRSGTLSVIKCGLMQKFDHKKLECSFVIPFLPVDCGSDVS